MADFWHPTGEHHLAAVSGLSYYDYVRRHVFTPTGMSDTDFHTKPRVIAHGYATQPTGDRVDVTTTEWFPYIGSPYHGAFSSAPDLLRFATALHGGELLTPAFTRLVTSGKQALSPAARPRPVLRLRSRRRRHRGRRVVGHSGSGQGRATNLDVFPDSGWFAVVLSNYDTSIAPMVDLARQLITRSG